MADIIIQVRIPRDLVRPLTDILSDATRQMLEQLLAPLAETPDLPPQMQLVVSPVTAQVQIGLEDPLDAGLARVRVRFDSEGGFHVD